MKIFLYSFLAWIARTWFKSTFINVLSALKWQASLNLSLNSQIKVDTVKNTSFEVLLPYRMDWNPRHNLIYSFLAWIARTWLDCKKRVYLAWFGSLFSYLFKSTFINVFSTLKWQASLNLSLSSQIKVDAVKNTSFEVLLPHRMD